MRYRIGRMGPKAWLACGFVVWLAALTSVRATPATVPEVGPARAEKAAPAQNPPQAGTYVGQDTCVTCHDDKRAGMGKHGLAVDSQGRVYTATAAGVQVFSPQGRHLGTIPLSRSPQNLAFAGADKKTLYVVGRGAAFQVQMLAQGFQGRAK